jgi:beta-glucosidase
MFATGIECSYPVVASADGGVRRVDEMAKCGHYRRWREDFQLVKQLGLEYLRYGPP